MLVVVENQAGRVQCAADEQQDGHQAGQGAGRILGSFVCRLVKTMRRLEAGAQLSFCNLIFKAHNSNRV